jgi:hypothetical protein
VHMEGKDDKEMFMAGSLWQRPKKPKLFIAR